MEDNAVLTWKQGLTPTLPWPLLTFCGRCAHARSRATPAAARCWSPTKLYHAELSIEWLHAPLLTFRASFKCCLSHRALRINWKAINNEHFFRHVPRANTCACLSALLCLNMAAGGRLCFLAVLHPPCSLIVLTSSSWIYIDSKSTFISLHHVLLSW